MSKKPVPFHAPFPRWVWVAFVCLALGAAFGSLAGCAGMPRTVYVPDGEGGVVERVEVPHYLPGTGVEIYSTEPAGAEGGPNWLLLGAQILGVLTGTSGLLAAFSPAGRKAWGVVGDPNAKWGPTVKALGNVATFGAVPPPKDEPA